MIVITLTRPRFSKTIRSMDDTVHTRLQLGQRWCYSAALVVLIVTCVKDRSRYQQEPSTQPSTPYLASCTVRAHLALDEQQAKARHHPDMAHTTTVRIYTATHSTRDTAPGNKWVLPLQYFGRGGGRGHGQGRDGRRRWGAANVPRTNR